MLTGHHKSKMRTSISKCARILVLILVIRRVFSEDILISKNVSGIDDFWKEFRAACLKIKTEWNETIERVTGIKIQCNNDSALAGTIGHNETLFALQLPVNYGANIARFRKGDSAAFCPTSNRNRTITFQEHAIAYYNAHLKDLELATCPDCTRDIPTPEFQASDALSIFRQQDDKTSEIEVDVGQSNQIGHTPEKANKTIVGFRSESVTCELGIDMWLKEDDTIVCGTVHGKNFSPIDGCCNNPKRPGLGKSQRPFIRFLPPDYCDGIFTPRCAASKRELPNARIVSTATQFGQPVVSQKHSVFVMQWGQYISHDLSFTPLSSAPTGKKIECKCKDGLEGLCYNIIIPSCDINFVKQACMPLVRSAGTVPAFCNNTVWREQINQVTPFIDASTVYGSTKSLEHDLKISEGGLLKVSSVAHGILLPDNEMLSSNFSSKFKCPLERNSTRHDKCFAAGDFRVNETPTLTCTHLLWVRQHNRIARILSELNPHWNAERIFLEARQIVIAQHQHITYTEYLPEILGEDLANQIYDPRGRARYSSSTDARIANAFSTAAFRFGHSQITDKLHTAREKGANEENEMTTSFFDPKFLYDSKLGPEGLLSCLLHTSGNEVDCNFANVIRNELFSSGNDSALDLLAVNIQRGRDHGIPGYPKWREWCNLSPIQKFSDICGLFGSRPAQILQTLYQSVDDIDLYVGGLLEKPVEGGVVGPTFSCILSRQFQSVKRGDRFWFDNTGHHSVFHGDQVAEIKKISLAGIICRNFPQIKSIQPKVMCLTSLNGNEQKPCSSLPDVNLKYWKERQRPNQSSSPDATNVIPIIVRHGRFIRREITPTITFWTDDQFNTRLPPNQRGDVGDLIFTEVGFEKQQISQMQGNFDFTGILIRNCSITSRRENYLLKSIVLINDGCPNFNLRIPIAVLPTTDLFKFRFSFPNFHLGRMPLSSSMKCSVQICFAQQCPKKPCPTKL